MILTDGKRTVGIEMRTWTGSYYSTDWAEDFFNAGTLERNRDTGVYQVEDVGYCIEQANDWANGEGDYYEEQNTPDLKDRVVFVKEIYGMRT